MTVEERKDVIIIRGNEEELEDIKSKYSLKQADGVCVIKKNEKKYYSAEVPPDEFYKEKIKQLESEKQAVEERAETLRAALEKTEADWLEKCERVDKLERALIEAAIG